MNFLRRIRLALVAVVLAPLLAACNFTGNVDITDDGQYKVDLVVTESSDVCDQTTTQSLLEGLSFQAGERVGECRITGTASPALAALLGVNLVRDDSGYRLTTSSGLGYWQASSVDVKVRFPGPITSVEGADQSSLDEIRVLHEGTSEVPTIDVASRVGYGPSKLEWAAGLGLLTGVGLTLLGVWLVRLRRKRLLAPIDWPAPQGYPEGHELSGQPSPDATAFWSGRAQPAASAVGERSKRAGSDPSVWAPPPG